MAAVAPTLLDLRADLILPCMMALLRLTQGMRIVKCRLDSEWEFSRWSGSLYCKAGGSCPTDTVHRPVMHNSHAEIENQMGAYLDAATKVLKDAGKPLHYKEITLRAITRKLITPGGKTPADSMNSRISVDIKNKGTASGFVRTKAGMHGLNPKGFRKGSGDAAKVQNSSESKKTQFIGKGGEYLVAGRLVLRRDPQLRIGPSMPIILQMCAPKHATFV